MQYGACWQALAQTVEQRSQAWSRTLGALGIACLVSGVASAQSVSNYSFTQSAGTYTGLPAPKVLGASTTADNSATDDAVYAAPLPFAFTFNGVAYTSLSVSTNGFVTFGSVTPQVDLYNPLDATTTYSGAVAVLASDLAGSSTAGNLGELSYSTLGNSPNRSFVVQWKHFARFGSNRSDEDLNFQLQLSETTNTISLVYGPCALSPQPMPQQVGLRGRSSSDAASRVVANNGNWDASTAATSAGTAALSSKTYPKAGLTYTFGAPLPAAPTALAFSAVTAGGMTVGFTDNSLTENSFLVEYSADATFANASSLSITSTSKTTTGTTYLAVLTGLAPATTYYVRVRAVGEAQSAPLLGQQATAASQAMTVAGLSYGQSGAPTYRGYTAQALTSLLVRTTGTANPPALSSLTFDLGSTSGADLGALQLYRTASSIFDPATATLLPTTGGLPLAGHTCTFALSSPDPLGPGTTYYWLTCDVAATATPGHSLGAVPTAAIIGGSSYTAFALSGSATTRPIALPLNGTYTVGTGGDYSTLTQAVADLTRRGVATGAGTAGVTLALTNQASTTVYNEANGEAFPLVLRTAAGMDAAHRVTIRPASGVQASISGSATGSAIVLSQGADYFTLDGANTPGVNTRDLSITNTSTAASAVVWLQSQGLGAGASYNEVRNLNLRGGTITNLTFGVLVGNTSLEFTSKGADNDYVNIENNTVANCYVGILAAGTTTTSAGGLDGLSIRGNLLGPATNSADNLGYAGLEVSYAVAPSLRGNTVQNVRTAADLDATGIYVHHATGLTLSGNTVAGVGVRNTNGQFSAFGIYLGTGVANATVSGNVVRDVSTTSISRTGLPTGVGVYVGTATLGANVELSNNMIGSLAGQFGPIGMFLDADAAPQSGIRLYYNTVGLQGSYASASGAVSTALYVPLGTTGIDSRNNILANTLTGSNQNSQGYALYSPAGVASYTASNYNNYYVKGPQNNLAVVGVGTCSTLDQLQSSAIGLGQDAQSLTLNPDFASDTDLHIDNRNLAVGTPLGSIAVDIDGDSRSATAPTIGADELQALSVDVQPVALAAPAAGSTCFGSTEPVVVAVRNTTTAALDFTLHPLLVMVTVSGPVSRSFTTTISTNAGNPGGQTLAGGATVNVPLPGTLNMTATGSYAFAVTATAAGDGNTANDQLAPETRVNNTPAMLPAAAALSLCGGSSTSITYAGYGSLSVSPMTGVSISGSTVTFSPSATTRYAITGTSLDAAQCPRTVAATITVNTSTTWTGAAGSDWFAAGNWTNCVPSRATDAVLPAGAPTYPRLDDPSATAEARSLTLSAGASLGQSAGTLALYGDFTSATDASLLTLTGGAVELRGTKPQVMGVASLYDLRLSLGNALATATLGGDLTVSHTLTLAQGVLATDRYALTLPASATLVETETSYVLGQVRVPGRSPGAGQAETFGGIGLKLTPSASSAVLPGATTVVRTTGVALRGVATSQSILRYFDIQPTVDQNLDVRLDLAFWEHERNGIATSNLQLFKSTTGTSGPWLTQAATVTSPTSVSQDHITDFSTWTLGSTANPLPVELSQFDATRQGADALLTWTTASELNNRGFEVQASTDGQAFQALGFVAGAGNSATTRRYRYLDQAPGKAGLRYYRLRQLDANGTASYSPVRTLAFEAATAVLVQAAPNPFSSSLSVTFTLPAEAPVALALTDALGRPVYQQALGTLPAGPHQSALDNLAALPSGLYLLRVTVAGNAHTLKVVKE